MMSHDEAEHTRTAKAVSRRSAIWLWLSIAAGVVAILGSLVGLSSPPSMLP